MSPGVRSAWIVVALAACAGCTIGGVNALPPIDAGSSHIDTDAADGDGGDGDGATCTPAADTDGDGLFDCDELVDSEPYTDPNAYNGLTVMVGERPEGSGTCHSLDDFAEMESRFAGATKMMDIRAGWDFDTGADAYSDPSYGFDPAWAEAAAAERFSLRYTGTIHLAAAGQQCFSIDIGAIGTDIFFSGNNCGQIYLDGAPVAVSGFEAPTASNIGCVELGAGEHDFDVVFWYFNVLSQAKLHVKRCTSASGPCTPAEPLVPAAVHALP